MINSLEIVLRQVHDEEQRERGGGFEHITWDTVTPEWRTFQIKRFKRQLEVLGNPHLDLDTAHANIKAALIGLHAILADLPPLHSYQPSDEYVHGVRGHHLQNLAEAVKLLEAALPAGAVKVNPNASHGPCEALVPKEDENSVAPLSDQGHEATEEAKEY